MSTSIKAGVLEELKDLHLTRVHGRKPTATDIDRWEDEAAEIATTIQTNAIPGGQEHGHQAIVIPADEYGLVIDDNEYIYIPPTDPGSYPELDGDEEDHERERAVADHKVAVADYQRYLGVQEHLRREMKASVDEVWIRPLQNNRGGYAQVTIKAFLGHLRTGVAKLTTKESKAMKKAIEIEWNRTEHIAVLWKEMEKARAQAERWDLVIDDQDMVEHAYVQMEESGIFDKKHLMGWERKETHEKTWGELKTYFGDEYEALLKFEPSLGSTLESAHHLMEGTTTQQQRGWTPQETQVEVSQYFDELRRDALVGNEQIQQMSEAFTGAAGTMKEVMERLKEANAEIKSLTQINANLTNNIKQLTENNKTLAAALKELSGKKGDTGGTRTGGRGGNSNPNGEKCNICKMVHQKPFKDHCWELERNADKRPADWVSRL